jgi:glycosyltransferase involved in cell wall biosynthesis
MVSDFYPPVIGGMERHVQTLSHELVRRGHDVAVATLWQDGSPAFERDQGVHVHRLSGLTRLLTPFYESKERHFHPTLPDPGIMAGLRRVIAQERPDIVHARGWMLYSHLPLKVWSKAKLVVTLHDFSLVCPTKTYVHDGRVCQGARFAKCVQCASAQYGTARACALTAGLHISSRLHKHVDRYIAISSAVRDASIAATGSPPQAVDVVPTFIPDGAVKQAATTERPSFLPGHDNYILFVGALGRHKGLNVLLDAYVGLHDPAPLIVIGTERSDTPAQFPVGVTVVRNAPHAQVMAAWAHAAVGVVPSVWPEPFGQVAIEAMACGRAVIASNIGGLRDAVIDGETGVMVPPGDVTALREALRMLMSDPARRARMGEAGRHRAQLFFASTVVPRIEQVYAQVLAASPAADLHGAMAA